MELSQIIDHPVNRIEELLPGQIAASLLGPECCRPELRRHFVRVTPAMESGITDHVWSLRALLASR
jgi:hypothetical protein